MYSVPSPYGLTEFGGQLYSTYSDDTQNGIVAIKEGEAFAEEHLYAHSFPNAAVEHAPYFDKPLARPQNWKSIAFEERFLYVHSALGTIYDVSSPATFSVGLPRFAWGLDHPLGIIYHPVDDLLYVTERGTRSVKALPPTGGIDARLLPPIAAGFRSPSCVRFDRDGAMFVCDMDGCSVWRVDFA